VVALSGGADSVALLDLLHRLGPDLDLKLVSAHLDHGLREDSREDVLFCADLCRRLDVPLRTSRIEIATRAASTGLGLEATARDVRYRWLEEVREHENADRIALGHHFDDHVETLLLWIFRGTGLAGMRGIAAAQGTLVRPLRDCRRAEIRAYLRQRGLAFRTDPSNASAQFLRNRVRHELIPLLTDLFEGDVETRLAGFARRLQTDLDALEALAHEALDRLRRPDERDASPAVPGSGLQAEVRLRRPALLDLPKTLQYYVLREILAEIQPAGQSQRWNEAAFLRVLGFLEEGLTGKRMPLPGGGWVRIRRDEVAFVPPADSPVDPERPASRLEPPADMGWNPQVRLVQRVLPPSSDMVTLSGREWALFDADRVRLPLLLRPVRTGDRMRPVGMTGRKKLMELLRERGIPGEHRGSMLVVQDAERIIWAVGVATAEEARLTPNTKRVLKLSLEPVF
jgi:tRNA(Ile)-lysidine synthase